MKKLFQKYSDAVLAIGLVPFSIWGILLAMSPTKTSTFEGISGIDVNPLDERLFGGAFYIAVLLFAITCLRNMYRPSRG